MPGTHWPAATFASTFRRYLNLPFQVGQEARFVTASLA